MSKCPAKEMRLNDDQFKYSQEAWAARISHSVLYNHTNFDWLKRNSCFWYHISDLMF